MFDLALATIVFSVYLRPPAPHLFVDDTVTCDSSEANRAWSSLPAETLACLPLTDSPSWDKVQAAPSVHPASKILIFFSLWEPVPLRSGRAVLIQNHGQWSCAQGKISAPPPVDRSHSQRKMELSEWWPKTGCAASWQCESREIMQDVALFVKIIHVVIR